MATPRRKLLQRRAALRLVELRHVTAVLDRHSLQFRMLALHAIEDLHRQQIRQRAANRQRRRVAQGVERQPHSLRRARRRLNRAHRVADARISFEPRRAAAVLAVRKPHELAPLLLG